MSVCAGAFSVHVCVCVCGVSGVCVCMCVRACMRVTEQQLKGAGILS